MSACKRDHCFDVLCISLISFETIRPLIDSSFLSIFHHVHDENGLFSFDYRYHYMDSKNTMIFRYDNAPHHPEAQSFPHHKHTTVEIKESEMPNIRDILSEIHHHIIKGLLSK